MRLERKKQQAAGWRKCLRQVAVKARVKGERERKY
jgi:hypothetical protein